MKSFAIPATGVAACVAVGPVPARAAPVTVVCLPCWQQSHAKLATVTPGGLTLCHGGRMNGAIGNGAATMLAGRCIPDVATQVGKGPSFGPAAIRHRPSRFATAASTATSVRLRARPTITT